MRQQQPSPLDTAGKVVAGYLMLVRQWPEGTTRPGPTADAAPGVCRRCTYCSASTFGWCGLILAAAKVAEDEWDDVGLKAMGPDWDCGPPDAAPARG